MGMYTQDFKLLCVKYLNTGEILPFFFLREYFLFILQVHAATANETPSLFHFQSPLITGALNEPLRCSPTAPPSTPPLVSPSRAGNPTSSSAGLGVSPQPGQSQGQHCTGDWEKLSLIPAQCAASSPLLVSRTRNVPPRHFLLLSWDASMAAQVVFPVFSNRVIPLFDCESEICPAGYFCGWKTNTIKSGRSSIEEIRASCQGDDTLSHMPFYTQEMKIPKDLGRNGKSFNVLIFLYQNLRVRASTSLHQFGRLSSVTRRQRWGLLGSKSWQQQGGQRVVSLPGRWVVYGGIQPPEGRQVTSQAPTMLRTKAALWLRQLIEMSNSPISHKKCFWS